MPKYHHLFLFCFLVITTTGFAQMKSEGKTIAAESGGTVPPDQKRKSVKARVLYGTASYYADKFNGRQTATGHIYSHDKFTAASVLARST